MFQKKILPILLGLFAVVALPTVALAQTDDSVTYDNSLTDWEYSDYDWGDYSDDSTEYSDEEIAQRFASVTAGMFAVGGFIMAPLFLGIYIYTSIAYIQIAKKLNHPNPWYAWVPVLRGIQRFQIAGMSSWFVLLMIVSPVNLVLSIIALMKTFEKRGMDKLLALLALIPGASLILIGILAWKKDSSSATPAVE